MNDKHAHLMPHTPPSFLPVSMMGWCYVILAGLVVAIFCTAVAISAQTQEHHRAYHDLQKLKRDLRKMQVEQQRLLIEQQTFSATPQVAHRSVSELGMIFPLGDNRRVIVLSDQAKGE